MAAPKKTSSVRRQTPSVNLLKRQQRVLRIQSKRLELISSLSLFILIFYCVGFVSTLFYLGYLNGSLLVMNKKIENEKEEMEKVEKVREDYYLLKERTSAIKEISDNVGKHQAIIEKVLSFFPEGVSIDGMSITEEGLVTFNVKANSMEEIESLFDIIKKEQSTDGLIIEFAGVDSLSVSDEGDYSFGMILLLNDDDESKG